MKRKNNCAIHPHTKVWGFLAYKMLRKLLYIIKSIKKDPELSKEAIQAIEDARKRMNKGHYYTEKEAKKILGLA